MRSELTARVASLENRVRANSMVSELGAAPDLKRRVPLLLVRLDLNHLQK